MEVVETTWDVVKPIWDEQLWPGRDSQPVTPMQYLGGYNPALKNETPLFLALKHHDLVVGVNSIVRTKAHEFRSRGLYVCPSARGDGNGVLLLRESLRHAKYMGAHTVWSIPREEALATYLDAGFIAASPVEKMDYGWNCYALASLRTLDEIAHETAHYRTRREHWHGANSHYFRGHSVHEIRNMMRDLANEEEQDWR